MTPLAEVLGQCPALVELREMVRRVLARQAESRHVAPILILGETGVGKGWLARAIHRASTRASGPFVHVSCAAIPETLLEPELFGFERGAFTDARASKPGLFHAAHGGTLFLDEVGLLPPALQGKLLAVLDDRTIRRLGSTRDEAVDAWVIAATSEDLEAALAADRFREDLYHRLAVLTFRLPPLRERGGDIITLAEHHLGEACRKTGVPRKSLAPDAVDALLGYPWPGNVRELGNLMERVAMLSEERVVRAATLGLPHAAGMGDTQDVRRAPLEATRTGTVAKPKRAPADAKQLEDVLRRTDWNISRTAAILGLSRNTVRYLIVKHRLRMEPAPGPAAPGARPRNGTPPTNLPRQLTSFIGREREIAEIQRLLEGTRLLTLTGAGGSGKTRLAVEVAATLTTRFPDGVWLVELGALTDPILVPRATATTLGVREEANRPIVETLATVLHPKESLLVLDNCEHVVAACAQLAQMLLQRCPTVRILTTSREPLAVAGEVTWRVPSLALPAPEILPPLEALIAYEGIRLFVERAMTAQPGFVLAAETALAVAQICYRLDGIPLAIELAAARLKVLSVQQINERLRDRFRLLTGGSRVGLPRHQTLRSTMDWSYQLLSEEEGLLFGRLAVFAGPFSLESAEAVCSGNGLEEARVLDLLSTLANKSLVSVETAAGAARYRLLETIRAYAQEKLQACGEGPRLAVRHREWYLGLAERSERAFDGLLRPSDPVATFDRLEVEYDNVRAALAWRAPEQAQDDARLRLVTALWRFWEVRGRQGEGRVWLEATLAEMADAPPDTRANALNGAGNLARNQGDYTRAVAYHREALAIRRGIGDIRGIAGSLNNLGVVAHDRGEYRDAAGFLEQALPLWAQANDTFGYALSLNNLGRALRFVGDDERARALGDESLRRWRGLGHGWGTARALNSLGDVERYWGDAGRARALYEESLGLRREIADKHGIAVTLTSLAELARRDGELERAGQLCEESLALRRALGDRRGVAIALNGAGLVLLGQGDVPRASQLCEESLALRRELEDKSGIAWSLDALGVVHTARGEVEQAARLFSAAETLREAIGAPLPTGARREHEEWIAVVRAELGDAAFRAAWADGRALDPLSGFEFTR